MPLDTDMSTVFSRFAASHRRLMDRPLDAHVAYPEPTDDPSLNWIDAKLAQDIADGYAASFADDEESAATCAAIHGYAARVDPHEQVAEQRRRAVESRHASEVT